MTVRITAGVLTDTERLMEQLYRSIRAPGLNPQNTFLLLATLLEREFAGPADEAIAKRFVSFIRDPHPAGLEMEPEQLLRIVRDFKHPQEQPPYNDTEISSRMQWMRKRVNELITIAMPPIGEHRRPTTQEQADKGSITTFIDRGANYIIRRLQRDHPKIARQLAAGVFKSARQAGIAAGFIKVPTALDKLRKAWKMASDEDREAFMDEILVQGDEDGR